MQTLLEFINTKKKLEVTDGGSSKENSFAGTLHELLVGYHLQDREHMAQHPNQYGESPKQAHDRIVNHIFPEKGKSDPKYKDIDIRAKDAATLIRSHTKHKIKQVSWTSKDGDVRRVTGRDNSQDADPSDIYIHHPNNKFFGISLKSAAGTTTKPTLSNPGYENLEKFLGIDSSHHHQSAQEVMIKKFPKLRTMTQKQISAEMDKNPKMKALDKSLRPSLYGSISKAQAKAFSKLPAADLSNYIRTLMRATPTGHQHLRITSVGLGTKAKHHAVDPTIAHDHILNDHKNLSVRHKGTSVQFLHKGTPFFFQRTKPRGGAGVMGTIKTLGNAFKNPSTK